MANTLTNIMDKILVRALPVLRESATYARMVSRDYRSDAVRFGDTVTIEKSAGAVTTRAVTPGVTPPTPSNRTPNIVTIPMTNWRESDHFHMSDRDMTEVDRNTHFLPTAVEESVRGLANYINGQIADEYKDVYGFVGAPGTALFSSTSDVAVDARKLLKDQLSSGGWRGIISHAAEANFLKLADFKDADKTGESGVKVAGQMGMKFGVDWFTDHAVPTHTAGTSAAATVTLVSDSAVGDETVTLAVGASTGTIVVGDIITITGDTQNYVATTAATLTTAGVSVGISPPLKVAVDGTGTAVSTDVEATHVVNMVFQPSAFQYVQRPIARESSDSRRVTRQITDPATNMSLRLEMYSEFKQTAWGFDVLFGTQCVRPEYAVRLASSV